MRSLSLPPFIVKVLGLTLTIVVSAAANIITCVLVGLMTHAEYLDKCDTCDSSFLHYYACYVASFCRSHGHDFQVQEVVMTPSSAEV